MARKISDECISCAACEAECPVGAISEGSDIYVVDASKCVDCVGHYDSPQCESVCPTGAISKA